MRLPVVVLCVTTVLTSAYFIRGPNPFLVEGRYPSSSWRTLATPNWIEFFTTCWPKAEPRRLPKPATPPPHSCGLLRICWMAAPPQLGQRRCRQRCPSRTGACTDVIVRRLERFQTASRRIIQILKGFITDICCNRQADETCYNRNKVTRVESSIVGAPSC